MNDYILHVPLIGQRFINPLSEDGLVKFSGTNLCWHAAMSMIAHYHEAGPREAAWTGLSGSVLPKYLENNRRINEWNIPHLARQAGFEPVQRPTQQLSADDWIDLLKKYGPIWAAGSFGAGNSGHAIVIKGVKNGMVVFNDPWGPKEDTKSCNIIEYGLVTSPYAMLAKSNPRKLVKVFQRKDY